MSGVYKIQSVIKSSRFYIGSSVNITRRWKHHISRLKLNKHENNKLQRHFNKYGESDLQFSILIECDRKDLIRNEQYFIDKLNPYFNILKIAYSALGFKHSKKTIEKQKKIKISDEHKAILREKLKGNKNSVGIKRTDAQKQHLRELHMGDKNPQYGKHRSDETKKKMRETVAKSKNNHN